jgi:hypothetical protein
MNAAPLAWLGLTGMLAVGLAAELASRPEAAPEVASPPLSAPGRTAAAATPATGNWVGTILRRPLFSPDRKPVMPAASGAAPAPGPADAMPRLSAVLITPGGRKAIFAPAQGKPLVAGPGARVGAYVVKSISAGQVVLTGGDGERVIRPGFASGPPKP